MLNQLRNHEYKKYPYVKNPFYLSKRRKLTEFDGIQKLVMLDRYSVKDIELSTLKDGDLVVVELKSGKWATKGYGTVKSIEEDGVYVSVEFPSYVDGVEDLDNVFVTFDKVEKPLEVYWEQIAYRVAKGLASVEKSNRLKRYWFKQFFNLMADKVVVPAGRVLYGAGTDNEVTLYNCFVLGYMDDSRKGIARHRETVMEIMSRGGGVGTNGSTLRPRGEVVKTVRGKSSGSVSWLNDLSSLTDLVQQGGSRRGAQMIALADWHPDVVEFIMCKIQNPKVLDLITKQVNNKYIVDIAESLLQRDKDGKPIGVHDKDFMSGANISVLVSNDFMNAVMNNEDWVLRFPDVKNLTKEQMEFYDKEWSNMGDVRKWEDLGLPVKEYVRLKAVDLWKLINISARYSAEPGVIFIDNCNHMSNSYYYAPLVVTNPCFTGDMKILTAEGYKTFKELEGKEVDLVNHKGNISRGKVWKSGKKQTVLLKFYDKHVIRCTDDHRFMLIDGTECEAKDLKGKVVMPFLHHIPETEKDFVKFGYIQGDGNTGRLVGKYRHNGLEVNIGEKDEDIRLYFGFTGVQRKEYLTGLNDILISLGFSSNSLSKRPLPTTFDSWTFEQKRAFLKGLFSANGSVVSNTRVSFKTTCKTLVDNLQVVLKDVFGIQSYITTNKDRLVQFDNGVYECRESYALHITRYRDLVSFYNNIGFIQRYKMDKLKDVLIRRSPKVMSVKYTGKVEDVFDFHEPETHWGVVEGVIVHNCGEQPLPANGVCNLLSINMAEMVDKNGKIKWGLLKKAVWVSQRMGDNVIDHSYYFLEENEKMAKSERRVGKGVLGLADFFIYLKMRYGSNEMLKLTDKVFNFIKEESYKASAYLAKEKGVFPLYDKEKYLNSNFVKNLSEETRELIDKYGVRNVCSLTIAPTGSVGTMLGVSTGLEPYFSFKYYRAGRLGFVEVNTNIAQKYFDENPSTKELPSYYVSAMDLTPMDHVKVQGVIQKHIDSAISKTCNAPKKFTVQDNMLLYELAWKLGCKGVTVYVDGSREEQVLILKEEDDLKDKDGVDVKEVEDEDLTSSTLVCKISFDEFGNMVKECQ